jgi:hypothetical protein
MPRAAPTIAAKANSQGGPGSFQGSGQHVQQRRQQQESEARPAESAATRWQPLPRRPLLRPGLDRPASGPGRCALARALDPARPSHSGVMNPRRRGRLRKAIAAATRPAVPIDSRVQSSSRTAFAATRPGSSATGLIAVATATPARSRAPTRNGPGSARNAARIVPTAGAPCASRRTPSPDPRSDRRPPAARPCDRAEPSQLAGFGHHGQPARVARADGGQCLGRRPSQGLDDRLCYEPVADQGLHRSVRSASGRATRRRRGRRPGWGAPSSGAAPGATAARARMDDTSSPLSRSAPNLGTAARAHQPTAPQFASATLAASRLSFRQVGTKYREAQGSF